MLEIMAKLMVQLINISSNLQAKVEFFCFIVRNTCLPLSKAVEIAIGAGIFTALLL